MNRSQTIFPFHVELAQPVLEPALNPQTEQQDSAEWTFCVNHPEVETGLRCNRCDEVVCLKCVELTPVGYRCKRCVFQLQATYFNGTRNDSLVIAAVSFILSAIAVPLAVFLFDWYYYAPIFAAIAGYGAGHALINAVQHFVRHRRSRRMRGYALLGFYTGALTGSAMGAVLLGFWFWISLPLILFVFAGGMTIRNLLVN